MEYSTIFIFIFYIVCVYIFLHTYYYLVDIDNCPCFKKDGKYAVNIDFMKFFQVLEIFILTVFLSIFMYLKLFNKKSMVSANIKNHVPKILLITPIVVLLIISAFMSYNVLNFYNNIKEDCKCANSWYRYFIYYEGIVSLISVFRVVISFILLSILFIVASLSLNNKKK
jgi:hypothetical protein